MSKKRDKERQTESGRMRDDKETERGEDDMKRRGREKPAPLLFVLQG